MKRLAVFLVLIAAILSLTGCGKGSITGTVTDSVFGAPLANVSVTVGKVTVKTDADGKYSIADIGAKSQTITANLAGYKTYTNTVIIEKKKTTVFDFTLTPVDDNKYGMISAHVTEFLGGAALEGATVTYGTQTAVTDEDGYFFMFVEDGTESELTVTKDGYAVTKVQNFTVVDDEAHEFEIPVRTLFHPDYELVPPTVTVTGLEAGDTVSGVINLTVEMDCPSADPFAIYSYVSTMARSPRTDATFDSDTATFTVDTTKYPNGDNYLRVLAYDYNGNATMLFVPFVVNNEPNDTQLPGAIAIHAAEAYTFGTAVGYYSKEQEYLRQSNPSSSKLLKRADGSPVDLNAVPQDTTFYIMVLWTPAANADGYSIYRSFNGKDYTWIGNSLSASYYDYSALLTPGQKVWYKIEPYNSFGKGTPVVRSIETLPSYKIYLKTPANATNNVSLTPTFTWDMQATGTFPAGTEVYHVIDVWDATDYLIHENLVSTNFYNYPGTLAPGYVYSWDIGASTCTLYVEDDEGYSWSASCAGGYNFVDGIDAGFPGSVNGEFYFTTEVPLQ